jgi:hypothetical protein
MQPLLRARPPGHGERGGGGKHCPARDHSIAGSASRGFIECYHADRLPEHLAEQLTLCVSDFMPTA